MRASERGIALLVVLWIAVILTLLLYTFLAQMLAETSLSTGYANRKRAEQLSLSAVDKGVAMVLNQTATHHSLQDSWANSDSEWYEVELGEGVFTAIRPAYANNQVYWGLQDEASKLNINVATKEVLMKLPGMTDEIAESIVDWRDPDENPQANGAESSYYATLQPGYNAKNANFETVEELLYVRGVTPALFWGEDRNQNGILDPGEDADGNGEMTWGFYPFLTVYSTEKNVRGDGQARLDLNTGVANYQQQLGDVLDGPTIQRMQQYILQAQGYRSIAHVLDVQGVTPEKFKQIADRLTILGQLEDIPGLININTAPKQVLMVLPNIREEFVDALIAYRTTQGVDLSNIGWLLDINLDDNLKRQQMKEIANFITVRSYQFRIDAVGRVGTRIEGTDLTAEGTPFAFRRSVAVYDVPLKRLLYFKDMSMLGFPYDPWEKPQSP
jgi:type II secretory pathway component PulK